ncbi:MAG: hypothetical protein G01um10143_688 [Parcubacteria group bacterium Gr01-1014_3]|nr:MAG: hypothetical protein G01um10143_688 [Parcubacteria group bacterium Gr01-1014_3]
MKKSLVAFVPIILLFSCYSPPRVETFGPDAISKIDQVRIESIDFYSDTDFTKPMPRHEYMDTAREEIHLNAKKFLPLYGMNLMNLLDKADANALVVKGDVCIQPSIVGVGLKLRAKVFLKDTYLFEVVGTAVSPPSYAEIKKLQAELAEKIIAAFAKKLGREKLNPPK